MRFPSHPVGHTQGTVHTQATVLSKVNLLLCMSKAHQTALCTDGIQIKMHTFRRVCIFNHVCVSKCNFFFTFYFTRRVTLRPTHSAAYYNTHSYRQKTKKETKNNKAKGTRISKETFLRVNFVPR